MLTGTIPNFSTLSSISYIDISHNSLSSTIPYSWLDMPNLSFFSAGFNQLHGSIPGPCLNSSRLVKGWNRHCTTHLAFNPPVLCTKL